VIAQSFERIHRSNLIGMGVLPLEFLPGVTRNTLSLKGSEKINIRGLSDKLKPRALIKAIIQKEDHSEVEIQLLVRIDTLQEMEYYYQGGILHYAIRHLLEC